LLAAARGTQIGDVGGGYCRCDAAECSLHSRTEKLGFSNLLYLGDVANLRLGGFAVNTDKIQRNPEQI